LFFNRITLPPLSAAGVRSKNPACGDGLLSRFKGIKEALHPRFFPGGGVFFDDPLPGGGVQLFNHILKRRLGLTGFFFLSQYNKLLCAGTNRTFYRLIPETAFLALPVTLFSGTALACQMKTPNIKIDNTRNTIPDALCFTSPEYSAANRVRALRSAEAYLNSEGRRSVRLHFSHSAMFLTLPFSKTIFILTSPPQEQKNFWVALVVRAFLLA
jgi:hypothetical protein